MAEALLKGKVPQPAWQCSSCTAHNDGKAQSCCRCNRSRPLPVPAITISNPTTTAAAAATRTAAEEEEEEDLALSEVGFDPLEPPETLWDITPASMDFWRMDSEPGTLQSPSAEMCDVHAAARLMIACASVREEPTLGDFPVEECRLVLLGKTGSGKSSTGNTVLGIPNHFRVGPAFKSTTLKCQRHTVRRFGITLQVVDTPGFFETGQDDSSSVTEVVKCLGLVSPGPHALLLTLPIGRFAKEEADTMQIIRSLFGEDIMRHLIIVFTHGDDLNDGGIDDILEECPPDLLRLLEETNRRYVVFNNKEKGRERNEEQTLELLRTVRRVIHGTCNQHFTSPFTERCQDSVMAHAALLAGQLRQKPSRDLAQELLRASLEANDRAQEMLRQLRSRQEVESTEKRSLQDKLRAMEEDRLAAYEQIHMLFSQSYGNEELAAQEHIYLLSLVLDETQRLSEDLREQLELEKKRRKACVIS